MTELQEKQQAFYEAVGDLLDNPYTWIKPAFRHCRWYPRFAGNGRFAGHGLIRYFSPECILIAFHSPVSVHRECKSEDEAFALIKSILVENSD